MIEQLLSEGRFDFINPENKQFIVAFTNALSEMGYTFRGEIERGYCWGKYMLVFTKANVKSKKVAARIYIREKGLALRLFFNDVTKHAPYISQAPDFIKEVFIGSYATCKHCKGERCKFQKTYDIGGVRYEKCNGLTFEFQRPGMSRLDDYLGLFKEFYPVSRRCVMKITRP